MRTEMVEGHCLRCKLPIEVNRHGEMWGELILGFSGGYGSFVDTFMDILERIPEGMTLPRTPTAEIIDGVCMSCSMKHVATLCHDCAHALCDFLGISQEEQARTTSHGDEYLASHPDHIGWDNPASEYYFKNREEG